MPAIHGSLSDDDFVALDALAKAKGMSKSDLVTAWVTAEIHKLPNVVKVGGDE